MRLVLWHNKRVPLRSTYPFTHILRAKAVQIPN